MDGPALLSFSGLTKKVGKKLERNSLPSARGLITVSESLAEKLALQGPPVATILNGYDPADIPLDVEPLVPEDTVHLVYTGMVYPCRQDPTPLLSALKELSTSIKVKVWFIGRNNQVAQVLAIRMGVQRKVEVAEAVSYHESLKFQRAADSLLFFLWSDSKEKGVYTGKLFEYL